MRKPAFWLVLGVLGCALAVVQARHESRALYSELQKLRVERDGLDTEWSRLLLEEGAWSQHRRIESMARTRLGMDLPGAESVAVMRLVAEGP
jgi:cell division protein FtsL